MSRIENFVVIYDITDARVRTKLVRFLFEYGIRTQFSVFEVEVREKDFRKFIELLGRKIKSEKDKIYVYPLDKKSLENVDRIGNSRDIIDDFFI